MSTEMHTELAQWSLPLWERVRRGAFAASAPEHADERLSYWASLLGSNDALDQRLAWAGVARDDVRRVLGALEVHAQFSAADAQALAALMTPAPAVELGLDAELPFDAILHPLAGRVAPLLHERLGARGLAVLSEESLRALYRAITRRLVALSMRVLAAELETITPIEGSTSPRPRYDALVATYAGDGLATLFASYPVLARLMATAVRQWVDASAELVERFDADRAAIEEITGPFPTIAHLEAQLGDAHNDGRTVAILEAPSGAKIVYKPKSLVLEAELGRILAALTRDTPLDLTMPRIVERAHHGWAEHVAHAPVADLDAAHRFYERAGMLTAVLHVLGSTDAHHGNVIAAGERPIFIDAETLMHPDVDVLDPSARAPSDGLRDSVIVSGMLPAWEEAGPGAPPFDNSGLGGANLGARALEWAAVNTDEMSLVEVDAEPIALTNRPVLDGRVLDPSDFVDDVVRGFERMYDVIAAHGDALLASDGLFARLRTADVRLVYRPTRIYTGIQATALAAELLANGSDRSIVLDLLSRPFLRAGERPNLWPLLGAELDALERLDVPLFTARADDHGLGLANGTRIDACFARSAWECVEARVRALGPRDRRVQTQLVRSSLHAWSVTDRAALEVHHPKVPELALDQSADVLLASARELASWIADGAMPVADGGLSWLGPKFDMSIRRLRYEPVSATLSDGTIGIALLFAALARIDGDAAHADLARRAVRPVLTHVADPALRARLADAKLGAMQGLGSIVWGLTRIGRLLEDASLLAAASDVARLLTAERAAEDDVLDVTGGSAGALLGLLALYEETGSRAVLERAVDFGERLVRAQVATPEGPRAWISVAARPLTGFSHGAAGIAYALLRLAVSTGDPRFARAAEEGIAYE
ncbi:type 2 lantipeptide synthetase LanM, partial [Myxococcota bacterium]|nr:type 2 lantipeptide synthetase LanM [Myxococcota bacterium]